MPRISQAALWVVMGSMMLACAGVVRADTLTLPAPRLDGPVSLEKALHQRRSVRDPQSAPLSVSEIGQLCWAAQGITDDKGHRTAPSARATYPLEVYVLIDSATGMAPGLYHYRPSEHALILRRAGGIGAEFRAQAARQEWIAQAPVIFIIAGDTTRVASMRERGRDFMYVEAGLAAQGFFLQAVALGLGSTYVGGFDPAAARAALALPAGEEVMAVLPVGRRP